MPDNLHQEIIHRLEDGSLEELNLEDTFNFECTESCMGRCCNNINILLDPWDIETMTRELGIQGQEFIKKYCSIDINEELKWPTIQLKHAAEGPCAFMMENGKCSIYSARPRNCRTSPVARAVRFYSNDMQEEFQEKIFMINPANYCEGYQSEKTWTVRQWFENCDAFTYYELSDMYLELVDYSVKFLKTPNWLPEPVIQSMMPFIFTPDILRRKMDIPVSKVEHITFYKRRIKALRKILTSLAAKAGYSPNTGEVITENQNITDLAYDILLGKE
ncbi:MAG: YkgJ family cysteine cluster protein [Clostridiales bacterium]|nr:YkgJ family cysteine cluster protein [Clostridiales bacterium]MCF8023651.1 YkgJ family cysteine cluster protein [Clostridiales bacterium]